MKLSLICLLTFAAYLWFTYPEPNTIPWEDKVCMYHGGLKKMVPGDNGQKTAYCRNGLIHGYIPSYNEQMGKERK